MSNQKSPAWDAAKSASPIAGAGKMGCCKRLSIAAGAELRHLAKEFMGFLPKKAA
jgi:hypothetical protein